MLGVKRSKRERTAEASRKLSKNGNGRPNTGGHFLRKNSSNGGKAIRTFWLHSRCGGRRCQGKIRPEISRGISITYKFSFHRIWGTVFPLSSPFTFCILPCYSLFFWGFVLVFPQEPLALPARFCQSCRSSRMNSSS